MTEDTGRKSQHLRLVKADPTQDPNLSKLRGIPNADAGAIQGNAYMPEDEYQTLYIGQMSDRGILQPPYNLRTLDRLAQENNALSPCIEAMVTNIDGTGYSFRVDNTDPNQKGDDDKIEQLRGFFSQPWPGMSFDTIRKLIRRDIERVGNAYIEVLRNAQDEIVFARHVDAKMMRILKLDAPIPVEKKITRNGKETQVTVMQRERRFCQLLNGITLVFFKELGASRDLDKDSGHWIAQGKRLPASKRSTEIIHFTNLPDAHTPYGVPRWINQLPSVLGSRKAEEYNLEFFNSGGVPPVMIFLQGGMLQADSRKAIETKAVFGEAASKNRIQVIEVDPTGGSMDKEATARVTVERFGAERQNDSMFENYDDKCENRVRRAFRLPPIFVGQAADYSFATAFASYTVTEAQVFKPERDAFDEKITMTLVHGLGYYGYRMESKPTIIEDATLKLQGIELALTTGYIEMEDTVDEINEACGISLKYSSKPTLTASEQAGVDNKSQATRNPDNKKPGQKIPGDTSRKVSTPVAKQDEITDEVAQD